MDLTLILLIAVSCFSPLAWFLGTLVPCCTEVTRQGGANPDDENNDSLGMLPYIALLQTAQARLFPIVSTVVAGGESSSCSLVNELLSDIPVVPESLDFRQRGYIKLLGTDVSAKCNMKLNYDITASDPRL